MLMLFDDDIFMVELKKINELKWLEKWLADCLNNKLWSMNHHKWHLLNAYELGLNTWSMKQYFWIEIDY